MRRLNKSYFFFSAFSVLTNNTDLEFGRLRAQLASTTFVYIKLLLLSVSHTRWRKGGRIYLRVIRTSVSTYKFKLRLQYTAIIRRSMDDANARRVRLQGGPCKRLRWNFIHVFVIFEFSTRFETTKSPVHIGHVPSRNMATSVEPKVLLTIITLMNRRTQGSTHRVSDVWRDVKRWIDYLQRVTLTYDVTNDQVSSFAPCSKYHLFLSRKNVWYHVFFFYKIIPNP